MVRPIELRVLELLAARLCHDLVGPLSAVANGIELLTEEDPAFVRDAIALIGDSARKANRRLRFYRFVYGFSGAGAALTGPPPHRLAAEFFAETTVNCQYGATLRTSPLDQQKLACAMLALAGEGLPRGGRLALGRTAAGPEIDARGEGAALSPEARAAFVGETPVDELTTRTVLPYFAGLLAEAQGCRVVVSDHPGGFRLAAEAVAAAAAL